MKMRMFLVLFSAVMWIVASGWEPASAQTGSVNLVRRAVERLTADLPESSTAEILESICQVGRSGQNARVMVFEGQIQSNSLAALPVKLTAGLRETNMILTGEDEWVSSTIQSVTLEPSTSTFPFRISVPGPADTAEWLKRGLMLPVVELRSGASGQILDATRVSIQQPRYPVPEFDPHLLGNNNVKNLKGYEVIWSATLSKPGSGLPLVFGGVVKNRIEKKETVLLQAGLTSRFGFRRPEEKWVWKGETELEMAPDRSEVPFEIEVETPAGVYVGIGNELYVGDVDILSEAERIRMQRQWEQAAEGKKIGPENIRVDEEVGFISVLEAGYAFTNPGQRNNLARFKAALFNGAENPQKVKIVFGFATSGDPGLQHPEAWHFKSEKIAEIKPDQPWRLSEQIRCHIRMHELIEQGRYRPFILVSPASSQPE